jgi:hypothetical protein
MAHYQIALQVLSWTAAVYVQLLTFFIASSELTLDIALAHATHIQCSNTTRASIVLQHFKCLSKKRLMKLWISEF